MLQLIEHGDTVWQLWHAQIEQDLHADMLSVPTISIWRAVRFIEHSALMLHNKSARMQEFVFVVRSIFVEDGSRKSYEFGLEFLFDFYLYEVVCIAKEASKL